MREAGERVLQAARKELAPYYPEDPDGSIPVGYIWARTLPCQNPACGAEIPLMRQFWLAKKEKRQIALMPLPNPAEKRVDFAIVARKGSGMRDWELGNREEQVIAGDWIILELPPHRGLGNRDWELGDENKKPLTPNPQFLIPNSFDPDQGTVRRANVECPLCKSVIDDDTTRALFRAGKAGQRMVAVVVGNRNSGLGNREQGLGNRDWELGDKHEQPLIPNPQSPIPKGKRYRLPTERDLHAYHAAGQALHAKREQLRGQWGIDPVPDELIPTPCHEVDRLPMYGMPRWGDVFNPRQQLALITFAEKVREVGNRDWELGIRDDSPIPNPQSLIPNPQSLNPEFSKAVATYLAILVDELARFTTVLNPWKVDAEAIVHVFGRQAIPMMWDYVENVPVGTHGGTWQHRLNELMEVLSNITQIAEALREESHAR